MPKNEATLEADLKAAILHALPWLPADQISHQDSFSFRFGHANVRVEKKARANARSRADVLVRCNGIPLAIFELKHPGVKLDASDDAQGLSYARMLFPYPPLVIISNGHNVRFLETFTGKPWKPNEKTEQTLADLIESGAAVAQATLKEAVSTLMGTRSTIWTEAVQAVTDRELSAQMGSLDDPLRPFVKNFLLKRRVTASAINHIQKRERLMFLVGQPLAGKSSVLRELALHAEASNDFSVLYVDVDQGMSIFDTLARILAGNLAWPVTSDEAMHWLMTLSKSQGPALVLAIDNLAVTDDRTILEINNLTSGTFGSSLCLVVAADEVAFDTLRLRRDGRTLSLIGRNAVKLVVTTLDDEEFLLAESAIQELGIGLIPGAYHNPGLRNPWLLRASIADLGTHPDYAADLQGMIPPIFGLDALEVVGERFGSAETYARYADLANTLLDDIADTDRPNALKLEQLGSFVIRRQKALDHIDTSDISILTNRGLARESKSSSGERVIVLRIPELMAWELAQALSKRIAHASDTANDLVDLLVLVAYSVPLGDAIAAHALITASNMVSTVNGAIVNELRKRKPIVSTLLPGMEVAAYFEEIGTVNIRLLEDGRVELKTRETGEILEKSSLDGEKFQTYSDAYPYLILSHLAGQPSTFTWGKPKRVARIDPELLLEVGATPHILRSTHASLNLSNFPIHNLGTDLSVVCHSAGIVEPITWSMACYFYREDLSMRTMLIDRAFEIGSAALVSRLDIALREIARTSDVERADWARHMLESRIRPIFENNLMSLVHD